MLEHIANEFRRLFPVKLKIHIKKNIGSPLTRLNENWSILQPIGPIFYNHAILDVGSHHGWFFHCWKDWCPDAEIHAFEPRKEAADVSLKLYGDDPTLVVNNVAVGEEEGEAEFQVLEGSKVSSSFLEHNQETWETVGFGTGEISRRTVPIITVDAYCAEHEIDSVYLMKIDVQGFEEKVLRGAKKTLPKIDHIFVESAIQPLYKDAPDFTDIYRFLHARGFHLMAMRAWHRGNHVLMETDMLFRRNDLAPPVDENIERVTESV